MQLNWALFTPLALDFYAMKEVIKLNGLPGPKLWTKEVKPYNTKLCSGNFASWIFIFLIPLLVVVVHLLSCIWFFATPWTAACQAPLSFTISQNLLKFMSIESAMLSNHIILCRSRLLLPSTFLSMSLFQWVISLQQVAEVLELQLQQQSFQWIFRVDFLCDQLVWSPCSPRDSQESSPASHFKIIISLTFSLLYGPALTSILDFWKNHDSDYTELCGQSDVSAL